MLVKVDETKEGFRCLLVVVLLLAEVERDVWIVPFSLFFLIILFSFDLENGTRLLQCNRYAFRCALYHTFL